MKSKYSKNSQITQANSVDLIALGKEKNSTTFWRSIILSKKLSKTQLKNILPFIRGALNVKQVLQQINYPKNMDNILISNIAKAMKNTAYGERNRMTHFLFPKEMETAKAEILAQKIDTRDAWLSFVKRKGYSIAKSRLMEIGNKFHDANLWCIIVCSTFKLEEEQIQYILKENCFSNSPGNRKYLLKEILSQRYYQYPLLCVDLLIEYLDLGGILDNKDNWLGKILERVDLYELELSQLIRLYFRTKENVLLETLFLKCVSFSKYDLSELLKNGDKKTKDWILSKLASN